MLIQVDNNIVNAFMENGGSTYVIGIGASAGGLEAINELFDNMPSTTGYSFVIIQHLSPDYKSLMGELLSKHTDMQVVEAKEGMLLKPNCIYLLPARKTLTIRNGMLKLAEHVRDHQPNTAIDIFFESLALDKEEKAVGIILSGTGTDGTKGIQAIKNHGGTVVVQDPTSAQFDGMPNSAVASGYVDLIVPPDIMPEELLEFVKEAPLLRSFNALTNQEEAIIQDILELVSANTGHDFTNYKRPTIKRRMGKRMAEKNIRSIADYQTFLINNPDEIKSLCKEFLLHVTKFFRDNEAFEFLRTNVIPEILSRKAKGDVIKVWDVACSTGEEAYSLAMLFDECMDEKQRNEIEIKIFASDISQQVIDHASRGFYNEEQISVIPEERVKKYFTREAGGYRVTTALRKMIVFARHDVTKDPPFNKIDLVVCRNMLIYMNQSLQKNILHKLHFAVNDEGFLFLGPSENIGILKDVMAEVDRKWKIYKCVSKSRIAEVELSYLHEKTFQQQTSVSSRVKNALNHIPEIFKETLLEEHDYAGIFIDRDFEVKQATGNFKKFLDFPDGNFNFNLLKMIPTDLSIALSTGIRKAIKDNEKVIQRNIRVHVGNKERSITAIIKPYLNQKSYLQPFLFIVLKEEAVVIKKTSEVNQTREGYTTERIEELESELRDTKENLQALVEEIESANEELQSSNEEIVSANEELQSTNEELQSLNEELHTVNTEHQLKIKELIELNDDLNNYFQNSEVGQVIIDNKLIIRKFSPVVTRQINLIASDIGRSIVDISTNMKTLDFINEIKSVIRSETPLEKEVPMDEGKVYLMRIVPYLRQNKKIDGVVVNFVDITEVKRLSNILQAVYNSSSSGIIALNTIRNNDGVIVNFEFTSSNVASQQLLGIKGSFEHKKFADIYGKEDTELFMIFKNVVDTGNKASFEYFRENTGLWLEVVVVKMMEGLVVTFSDITERKNATRRIEKGFEDLKLTSQQLEITNYKLEQSNLDLLQFASVASHDLKEPLRKIQAFGNLLMDKISDKIDHTESNYLNKVINSTNRMQVLIDDILTLSRLSKNDTPHSLVNLNEVISQILEDLEVSIKEKNARVMVQTLPPINGIPGQIHQLFQNLISNAIKFNDGQPEISIWSEMATPAMVEEFELNGGEFQAIHIQDNGIGFDERYSEKIFGVFQRLEKTHYQGTGIGLAIVKKIVDNHHGFIKAYGRVGEGARFTIVLPKPVN